MMPAQAVYVDVYFRRTGCISGGQGALQEDGVRVRTVWCRSVSGLGLGQ